MIAEGVRDTDLGAYQRAVRTLLVHPLVTATHPNGDALGLVRRFAVPLTRDLDVVAGYRLELAPTCARLVKRNDRLDPTQAVQPRDKRPFDRRRYAYLALVLGAVVRAGTQVALTELADALRRRAAEVDGLGFDPDDYRHRLAFVDVALYLEQLGVLRRLETSAVTWLKDPDAGEALYDVDRDAAHQMFVPPRVLQHVGSVRALLAGELSASRDTRRAASRQRIARLLLEHPVVYLDDLPEADRAYLRSQARSLADDLARFTGGRLERRGEGVALIDTAGGFTDRRFPGGGTSAQVALLLADAIATAVGGAAADAGGEPDGDRGAERATVPTASAQLAELAAVLDRARPPRRAGADGGAGADDPWATPAESDVERGTDAGGVARGADGGPDPSGPFLPDAWLATVVDGLVASHGRAFSADLRADPAALRRAALDVLAAFDLVRPVPGGVIARPAIARYRDVRVATAPDPQLSLLDAASTS
jgi:uncharacterized protein (TIGR02678 family)